MLWKSCIHHGVAMAATTSSRRTPSTFTAHCLGRSLGWFHGDMTKRQKHFPRNVRRYATPASTSSLKGRRVLVVGAGAIGLRTAIELLHHGAQVVLEAPHHPLHPSTCSMGAGGLWMPFHAQDDRLARWANETLDELLRMTDKGNSQEFAESTDSSLETRQPPLVEIVPAVMLFEHRPSSDKPEWATDARLHFQQLTVEMLSWQNAVYRLKIPPQDELIHAGYRHAWTFTPPVVDPPRLLQHWLDQVEQHANTADVIVPKSVNDSGSESGVYYTSIDELRQRATRLNCATVVNCAGLGAARLCHDEEMIGARGILHHYDRSSCLRRPDIGSTRPYFEENVAIDPDAVPLRDAVLMTEEVWGSNDMPCYLIPRGDTIVVGGSYLEGDVEASIRPHEAEMLHRNAERLGIDIVQCKPVGEWVGFRPSRTTVRCEWQNADNDSGVDVFHSYGYGGSGFTLNVGAAKECAAALLNRYS